MKIQQILNDEVKGSYDFFLEFTNLNPNSRGFGLTVDSTKTPHLASIASVGFALTAWIIAHERGYLSYQKAREITIQTLNTLSSHVSHVHGFFAHFLGMDTGQRWKTCEYSTIDTAICLNGVITAAAYYADDEIRDLAQQLLDRVDWNRFVFERDGKKLFHMAYNPDVNGDYVREQPGFISQWDMAAEQKMMYLQAAEQVDPGLARELYGGFSRDTGTFEGEKVIVNPGGNLFAYQFSEAWLDTRCYLDPDGIDWFRNTQLAALANRSYCMARARKYQTYQPCSWGLSAGDSPTGYAVAGSTPCLERPRHNGTVSIGAAIAALPYIPEMVIELMLYLYQNQPHTWGKYGFFDAYNLDVTPQWYSHSIYGINKGCSMIMIENYQSNLIWDLYTNSPQIQKALAILGFVRHGGDQNERLYSTERAVSPGWEARLDPGG